MFKLDNGYIKKSNCVSYFPLMEVDQGQAIEGKEDCKQGERTVKLIHIHELVDGVNGWEMIGIKVCFTGTISISVIFTAHLACFQVHYRDKEFFFSHLVLV